METQEKKHEKTTKIHNCTKVEGIVFNSRFKVTSAIPGHKKGRTHRGLHDTKHVHIYILVWNYYMGTAVE